MSNDDMRHDETPEDECGEFDAGALADLLAEDEVSLLVDADGTIRAHSAVDDSAAVLGTVHPGGSWSAPDGAGSFSMDEEARAEVVRPRAVEPADVAPEAPPALPERARVVPGWVTDRRVVVPWLGGRLVAGASVAGFHVVRSPWYSLRGLGVLVRAAGRWVARPEDAEVFAVELKGAGSLKARQRLRSARAKATGARALVAVSPLAGVWVWVEFGQWGMVPAVALAGGYAASAVVGWRAGRAGQSPAERAVARGKAPELSRPFVTEALAAVGFGGKGMDGEAVARVLRSAPARGGHVLEVELPRGTTAAGLLRKVDEFAGALGRPTECVVVEPLPRVSSRAVELFIAEKRLDEKGAPPWAWAKPARRSFFDGVPVGVDARGRDVVVPLFEASGLIAGASGMGKSFTARLLLMGAALDPTVTLLVHNLKGGPDYRAFAPVAHTLRSGSSDGDVLALLEDLRWMRAEVARRAAVLEGLPASEVPEGKITRAVADREGMGPIVLLIDEAQRAFVRRMRERASGPERKVGEEVASLLEDVVRTCRAVGGHVLLVTQSTKEGAIPSGILDQLVHRIGHGVTNIAGANLTLGSDAHGRTYRAADIDRPGIAYVGYAGGAMTLTAMAKVDLPEVERIVAGAARLRAQAGTLSGMAAGQVPADEDDGTREFLRDVLALWPRDEAGELHRNATSAELAALLHAADPEGWPQVDGAAVTRRMREAGVTVSSQRVSGVGRRDGRGVRLDEVRRAAGL